MASESQFITVIDKLTEYLGLLKEDGITALEVDRVNLAGLAHPTTPVVQEAPAAATAKPVKRAPRPKPAANLHFALAERMAACGDATPSELHRLVIVSDEKSFQDGPGEVLGNILKAAGYELISEAAGFSEVSELNSHAPRLALLMGEPALQAFRPRGTVMLARGKFKEVDGLDTLCTFDTCYIEKQSGTKKAVWTDMQNLLKRLELPIPDWVKKK